MSRCAFEEARVAIVGGRDPQVLFLVRERSAMIRYLGETRLQLCGRLYLPGDCVLLAILLRAGRHVPRVYPTWWNPRAKEQGEAFGLMQRQTLLAVHFYGDNGRRERSFVAENPFHDLVSQALQEADGQEAWTAACFDRHRQRILGHAGSVETLWQQCAEEK